MDMGVMSELRLFDVAKGVLIAIRGYSMGDALGELVEVAEQNGVGTLALARALVALAATDVPAQTDDAAAVAAETAWGLLFAVSH